MTINNNLKKDIFDGLRMANISWNGEMSEVDFLSRLYDLPSLPSNDSRYKDMSGDIWQHRVNNYDWDSWWIIEDERLDLSNTEKLKRFLEEAIHPLVRPDIEITGVITEHINKTFGQYGLKERLVPAKQIMGKTIFIFSDEAVEAVVEMEKQSFVSGSFSHDQIVKGRDKLKFGDYIGALSNARSFLEGVLGDIHERITGEKITESGDLTKDFKAIRRLLKLTPEQHSDDAIKGITSGLVAILQNIDTASNKMSERHRPVIQAEAHHAKFCLDAAISVADFLYGTLEFQFGTTVDLLESLISLLDSDIRLMPYEEIIKHNDVVILLDRLDSYTSRILLDRLISDYSIPTFGGYRSNDIFFASLNILMEHIEQSDLQKILEKCKNNNQAVGLPLFLSVLQKERVDLAFGEDIIALLPPNIA